MGNNLEAYHKWILIIKQKNWMHLDILGVKLLLSYSFDSISLSYWYKLKIIKKKAYTYYNVSVHKSPFMVCGKTSIEDKPGIFILSCRPITKPWTH